MSAFGGQSDQEVLQSALKLHQAGQMDSALVAYKEALERPLLKQVAAAATRSTVCSNLGALQMSLGSYEEAKEAFLLAVDAAPTNAQAHFNLAVILTSKLQDHRKALKHTALALKYDPSNYKALHLMGNVMQGLGRLEDAEKYFVMAEQQARDLQTEGASGGASTDSATKGGKGMSWAHLEGPARSAPGTLTKVLVHGQEYTMKCISSPQSNGPWLFHLPALLTREECESIAERASLTMERSMVMGGTGTNEERVSNNTWLSADETLHKVQERLHYLLKPKESVTIAQLRARAEEMQVVQYSTGGQFKAHQDSSQFHLRLFTALIYLNDLSSEQEGGTWFPFASDVESGEKGLSTKPTTVDEAVSQVLSQVPSSADVDNDGGTYVAKLPGLVMRPKQGDCVLFFNHGVDGEIDPLAVHAGLPVKFSSVAADSAENSVMKAQEKWIANYWFGQM